MNAEEFRKLGHEFVDWIVAYREQIESLPVMSPVKPGEIRARFPKQPPQEGGHAARALSLLQRDVMPGITHWNHPSFFAYFPSNTSYASILGGKTGAGESYDWLSSVRSIRGRFDRLKPFFPVLDRIGDRQRERCATRDRGSKAQKGDQSHRFDENLHFGPLVVRELLIGTEPNHSGQAPIVPARRWSHGTLFLTQRRSRTEIADIRSTTQPRRQLCTASRG